MSVRCVYGLNEPVGRYVESLVDGIDFDSWGDFVTLGVFKDERLIGGIVFNQYTNFDINITIAASSPYWCNRSVLRTISDHVFNQWGCKRASALVAKKNKRCRKFLEGMGFKLEGCKRKAFDGAQDLMLYGMMKDECRWL